MFLKFIKKQKKQILKHDFVKEGKLYYIHYEKKIIIRICEKCEWTNKNSKFIQLTEKGEQIVHISNNENEKSCQRQQLYDYITSCSPGWSKCIIEGREHLKNTISDLLNVKEVFDACELFVNDESDDYRVIIDWWDKISEHIRIEKSTNKNNRTATGRKGEWKSVEYEEERVGKKCEKKFIENNHAGYDIRSIKSQTDRETLYIEVKTITNLHDYKIHITTNEWRVAQSWPKKYIFHVWIFEHNTTELYVIDFETMQKKAGKENEKLEPNDYINMEISFNFKKLFKNLLPEKSYPNREKIGMTVKTS